ncbi:MAG: response regulator [Candidatus Omnitrophota bacterium]
MPENKKNVFIIDDDESICRALKFLLMTYGFEVNTFLSGHAFFGAVLDTTPGCLILDINMPGFDGWEVQEIQKRLEMAQSKRQIIFMTAGKDTEYRERAMKAGAVGFLQKPFNDQELVDLVNQSFLI